MATELIGTIHQYINRCKDTIVNWCKEACLPLTGGTVSGNVSLNGTNNNISGMITINGDHNGYQKRAILIKGSVQSHAVAVQDETLTKGTAPSSNRSIENVCTYGKDMTSTNQLVSDIYTYVNTSNNNALILTAYNLTNNDTTTCTSLSLIATNDGNNYAQLSHSPSSNTDNSTKIATTAWVNSFIKNFLGTAGAYSESPSAKEVYVSGATTQNVIEFKNGFQIIYGTCWATEIGATVTFSRSFSYTPAIVATRHYSNTLFVENDQTATGVHVYSTSKTGFKIGVNQTSAYITNSSTAKVYAMWVAIGM